MIRMTQLNNDNRAAFLKLLREPWQQHTWCQTLASEMVQWRYLDRPDKDNAITLLVMEDDNCVAMLDTMVRPYLLDGQRILVRETADWYSLPKARSLASGLSLLLQLRTYSEPAFVLGGSTASVNIISKTRGWNLLPMAAHFVLPLKARDLAANLIRRKWWEKESLVRIIPGFIPLKTVRKINPPPNRKASIKILDHNAIISLPRPNVQGLVHIFEQQHWDWLVKMPPNLAEVIGVQFFLDEVCVGFACLQVEPTATGIDGKIIYLQADDDVLEWVISKSSKILADRGVGYIRVCVSTPRKTKAVKDVGFLKVRDCTCHWFSRSLHPATVDVGFLRIDDSIPFHAIKGRKSSLEIAR